MISLAGQSVAHAEEEHIHYSDLFYGYDSSYFTDLTRAKLELYNDDVSYIMANTFNEYIDSPHKKILISKGINKKANIKK